MQLEYFQMIDRILDLNTVEKTITVEAQVPKTSTVFEGHFPGYPIMPGVLLIELMAQTSGWLLVALMKFERMPFLAAVKEAKMRGFVSPGELLTVEASVVHEGSGYAITDAKVKVGGKLRCNATLTFSHVPFPNPDLRGHMDAVAKRIGFPLAGDRVSTMPEPAEVWITGIGLASSLGEGLDANWDALQAGRINADEKTLRALRRASPGADQFRRADPQEGRPAPDGGVAAHRHLCRGARAGIGRRQERQGNPRPDGHGDLRRRRRARSSASTPRS